MKDKTAIACERDLMLDVMFTTLYHSISHSARWRKAKTRSQGSLHLNVDLEGSVSQ